MNFVRPHSSARNLSSARAAAAVHATERAAIAQALWLALGYVATVVLLVRASLML